MGPSHMTFWTDLAALVNKTKGERLLNLLENQINGIFMKLVKQSIFTYLLLSLCVHKQRVIKACKIKRHL